MVEIKTKKRLKASQKMFIKSLQPQILIWGLGKSQKLAKYADKTRSVLLKFISRDYDKPLISVHIFAGIPLLRIFLSCIWFQNFFLKKILIKKLFTH